MTILAVLVSALVAGPVSAASNAEVTVLPVSALNWSPLNPARGDKSPQAGTLWGDRGVALPTGFLVRFVKGFSSPPHIHNVTYRAVVISGLIHNDDPAAAKMWMPPGSFWTQPGGEVHITAANDEYNVALVEIDEGPYRVLPVEEAFDEGERPVNIDASNLVWLDDPGQPGLAWRAYLWGELSPGKFHGTFLKLDEGFEGEIVGEGDSLHAVVISGSLAYGDGRRLDPGSYFGSAGKAVHPVTGIGGGMLLYVRTNGPYRLQARGAPAGQ